MLERLTLGLALTPVEVVWATLVPQRMDYTVIGDGVNLAAPGGRANTTDPVLISESTFQKLKGRIAREID